MPATMVDDQLVHGPGRLLALRDEVQDVRSYSQEELEQSERMLAVVCSEEGLATFYELIQRAGSARRADRHREAVIDYATAGELFITTILEAIGGRRETDRAKLRNVLAGPFKDRVLMLCRLLRVAEDPTDTGSPLFMWWLHGYCQRNGIVHKGADSLAMLSEAARIGTVSMVVDIRELIQAEPDLSDIAATINWGRRVDETGSENDSEPRPSVAPTVEPGGSRQGRCPAISWEAEFKMTSVFALSDP